MNRLGAAAAAAASVPPTARGAVADPTPGFEVLGVVLGRSNDREVRDNIAARRARPLIGRQRETRELRIEVHDRKYGHPLLANVWYDFHEGVLSAVTIIWERDKGGSPALFQQRAEFLKLSLGLGPPQQPSKLVGRAKGVEVVLIDDATGGLVSERYAVPR